MTRYNLFNLIKELQDKQVKGYNRYGEISKLCQMDETGDYQYNKMIQSGELAETHFDYDRGYYDVCMYYYLDNEKKHQCRIWFGTIDDGDYGSWNELPNKEEAVELVEKARDLFKDMVVCPSHKDLNKIFNEIGIEFCRE